MLLCFSYLLIGERERLWHWHKPKLKSIVKQKLFKMSLEEETQHMINQEFCARTLHPGIFTGSGILPSSDFA